MPNVDAILDGLRCGRNGCGCRKGNLTHCPVHGDSTPSMSVTQGQTAALVKCFKGCESRDIISALTEKGLWGDERVEKPPRDAPTAIYRYTDATGLVVAEKGRFEWRQEGKRVKSFRWRLPDDPGWSGLDGLPNTALPLYNLPALASKPESPVFFVEGEKAAQSLIDRGMIAVCLGFGASHSRFGNALDPLLDRNVILWPDNDDPGAAYMARVAAILPHVQFVRADIPKGGDAYDYFEQGGTLDSLDALLKQREPAVRVLNSDSVEVVLPLPDGDVTFRLSEMLAGIRSTDAMVTVTVNVPGLARDPWDTRINLDSASAREGAVRELKGVYGAKSLEWTGLLAKAKSLGIAAWQGIDRSVSLADVTVAPRAWLVDRLIPSEMVTIPFSTGGGGKSTLFGAHLGVCLIMGYPWLGRQTQTIRNILIVDYEDTQEEWRLRINEVCAGMGLGEDIAGCFRWLDPAGIPLADQKELLRKIIVEQEIDVMYVDSALSAAGGDLLDTSPANRLANFLAGVGREYGVTTILASHTTKGEDGEGGGGIPRWKMYPYGSVFWHNLVRSTLYLESDPQPGSPIVDSVIYPRKGNRGVSPAIALRRTYSEQDGGPLTVETLTGGIPAQFLPKRVEQKQAIADAIEENGGSPMSVAELAKATGIKDNAVRAILNRNGEFVKVGTEWALSARGMGF